jgi:predicted CoA-binding protein
MKQPRKKIISTDETTFGNKNDVVRVVGFSVIPVKPEQGEKVLIKMTVKNVSSKLLKNIPWQILDGKKILYTGVRHDLKASDSFTVSVSWTASAGSHFFCGDADPDNILNEPRVKQFNNLPQGVDVIVR